MTANWKKIQKRVLHVQSCCFANLNQLLLWRSCWRRLRRCLSSLRKHLLIETIAAVYGNSFFVSWKRICSKSDLKTYTRLILLDVFEICSCTWENLHQFNLTNVAVLDWRGKERLLCKVVRVLNWLSMGILWLLKLTIYVLALRRLTPFLPL